MLTDTQLYSSTHNKRLSAGKTYAQLQQTQDSIEEQLQSGEAADPEFSAAILKRLRIHKAKAKLREIHRDLMQQNLDRTQLIPDGVDVAQEMGWSDHEQVCTGPIHAPVHVCVLVSLRIIIIYRCASRC